MEFFYAYQSRLSTNPYWWWCFWYCAFDIAKIAKNTKPYDDHERKLATHVQGRDGGFDFDDDEYNRALR